MLIKSVFLGLVLASIVLALPTRIEENNRNEINDLEKAESRRELLNKEQERRSMDKLEEEKKEQRRGLDKKEDEEKKEERRGVDKKEEEEKKEERRGVDKKEEEEKKEERRGVDKKEEEKKKEERRETEREEKKDERRGVDKKEEEEKKEERRRELSKKEDKKKESRRGVFNKKEEKKEERRGVDKKEEEEKKEERRGVDKKEEEEKKEERRGTETLKEERKKEERREMDKKEEEKKEERRETEEKKEERRGVDKKEEEEKKEERRELNKKEEEKKEERRGVDKKEEEEKKEERRGVDKKEEEEKKEERRETEQREKRRPTPAIKEERRDIDRKEEKKVERELNNRKLTTSKRETVAKESSLSICESVTDFKYFQKYEADPSKYIQCDPWGTGKVKSCPEGLLWNEWTLKCDAKDHIRNMTLDLSKFSVTTAQRPVLNCSVIGMECHNGGSCIESASGLFKCVCRSDYTGQYCESRVDLTDITHEILNSTFSVAEYRHRLHEENITLGIHYYERYKDQLDNQTYTELVNYLKLYPNGEVRYDSLVNSLVEDILENIYPDAGYLSAFNASEQSVVTMVQMIPSLLSYSRYSFERYEDVFAQYQQVLASLVKLLNNTIPTIQKEATQYTVLTHIFLNQTLSLLNNTVDKSLFIENANVEQPIQLSENDIKKALQINYNATLKATEQILQILEVFQTSIVKELETNPGSVVNATLGHAKFAGAKEMLDVLNQVSVASSQIWESLINYGFWYLTNLFSSSSKVDSLQRFSFNLNKF